MSCCDRGGLMCLDEALETLLGKFLATEQIETVALEDALGRVLAAPVVSDIFVPPHDNSAVDGYAINTNDLAATASNPALPLSQRIPAGAAPGNFIRETTARIFTGAFVPAGANAVVMQEDCEEIDGLVTLPATIKAGDNIRPKGQDIQAGQQLFEAGHQLKPYDLGLIASVGIARVSVYRKLTISILSTGDELAEPGSPLAPGQIYNSNRYLLRGMLAQLNFNFLDLGIIADTAQATEDALKKAAQESDVILTTGGVSVGEEDHVKAAIEKLGSLDLWRLAIKPGKPLAYGLISDTPIIGLPGNPGAVFVTFCLIARACLLKMQGMTTYSPRSQKMPLGFSIKKAGKRREFLRVRLNHSGPAPFLEEYPNQSSGVLSSASWSSGFAVIMENTAPQTGDLVDYISFNDVFGICF
ncbi:MAG: molybdopterin molybdotransferase MoeA [Hahellaceae bacterium]|nr:molybdopterin molybdotransferase MoeA [Hahellaceae bacterium]MCP5209837.1 molybdopterin molybdotransferase MoeA [Hahellaceae bacterium]